MRNGGEKLMEWHVQRSWGRAESGIFEKRQEGQRGWSREMGRRQEMRSERGQRGPEGVGACGPQGFALTEWARLVWGRTEQEVSLCLRVGVDDYLSSSRAGVMSL